MMFDLTVTREQVVEPHLQQGERFCKPLFGLVLTVLLTFSSHRFFTLGCGSRWKMKTPSDKWRQPATNDWCNNDCDENEYVQFGMKYSDSFKWFICSPVSLFWHWASFHITGGLYTVPLFTWTLQIFLSSDFSRSCFALKSFSPFWFARYRRWHRSATRTCLSISIFCTKFPCWYWHQSLETCLPVFWLKCAQFICWYWHQSVETMHSWLW